MFPLRLFVITRNMEATSSREPYGFHPVSQPNSRIKLNARDAGTDWRLSDRTARQRCLSHRYGEAAN